MTQSLSGKVAIITGASSGIGEAAASLLAAHGCKLTLAARSLDKLESLANDLDADALPVRADMTSPADITNMVACTLDTFGKIDILLANAGVYIRGEFAGGDIDDLARLLTINVDAVLRCAHAVLPAMTAQASGDIIVTSSVSGTADLHHEPIYSASKNAVQTFVHTVRRQVAGDGVRVMSLCPGAVANPLLGYHDAAEIERVSAGEKRYLTSEDCADALLFMLTRPRHVTVRDIVMLPMTANV